MNTIEIPEPVVSIGIDAAVVASHQVAIRGPGIAEDFRVRPTLAGLEELTVRLADWAPAMVVAEPTAGSWLPLLHAVCESGCRVGFVANRDSARLRKAIAGANKTDVIDADMLARSPEILGVEQAPIPPAGQIGLRRAMRRRRRAIVEAHRVDCRLWSLAAWAFPDLWRACGGHGVAQPVLDRWSDLRLWAGPGPPASPRSSPPTPGIRIRPGGPNGSGPAACGGPVLVGASRPGRPGLGDR